MKGCGGQSRSGVRDLGLDLEMPAILSASNYVSRFRKDVGITRDRRHVIKS